MRRLLTIAAVACLALFTVSATGAKGPKPKGPGGNSANAKLCQKGGWQNLVRTDGSAFKNQGACVSYGARGGTLMPKPTCTAGSDNFSDDANLSQPTIWVGGTIGTAYGPGGGVRVAGTSWFSVTFPNGTHLLFTGGFGASAPFRLGFSHPVAAVQLQAQSDPPTTSTLTLKAYDASNVLVDSDSVTVPAFTGGSLSVTSASNNIASFTVESTTGGFAETNIVWSCAA